MSNNQLKQLSMLYLLAHGLILIIPNAIFWDDWVLFNQNSKTITEYFKQTGSFFNLVGYLHNILLYFGPWLYRLLTLVLTFISGLLLYKILIKHPWFNRENSFMVSLFFLVNPFFIARVALIDFPYTFSVFLFFLAWSLIPRVRILSILFFFLSFITQSLLVFFAIPILMNYYSCFTKINYLNIRKYILKNIDLILLPFIWFAVKISFFTPYGTYENYNNQYRLVNLLKVPLFMIIDFLSIDVNVLMVVILMIIASLLFRHLKLPSKLSSNMFLFLGAFAIVCALFPYMILGHRPTFMTFDSRHQLLLPFPVALILVWLLGWVKTHSRKVIIYTFLAVSISFNIQSYTDFYLDWEKQKEIISFFRRNPSLTNSGLIIFDDQTQNAVNRNYKPYEWNGIMKYALGNEQNFGINLKQLPNYLDGKYDKYFNLYLAKTHVRKNINNCKIISVSEAHPIFKIKKLVQTIFYGANYLDITCKDFKINSTKENGVL